jgi:polyphosphate kinase
MAKSDLDAPQYYINRELSWLEFNDRVLREGLSKDVPLLERLKFLAIVSSNLDEFFMIRVAGLKRRAVGKVTRADFSGMTPQQQLAGIRQRVDRMLAEQAKGIREVAAGLMPQGIALLDYAETNAEQRRFLKSYFTTGILPVLTPLGADELNPLPLLPGLKLYLALLLEPAEPKKKKGKAAAGEKPPAEPAAKADPAAPTGPKVAIVPVPGGLPRFVTIPAAKGLCLVRLEEIMSAHMDTLFSGYKILAQSVLHVIRDADVEVDEDDAADLIEAMQEAVLARRRRAVIRLMIAGTPDPRLRSWLMEHMKVTPQDIYEVDGFLDPSSLMQVALRPGFEALKYPDWPPQKARDLPADADLWSVLQERDVLLFHPYESFDPVVQLVSLAADDPNVLAIKQTLYRTSGDSPIVRALIRAAENGKQVTVLVELKARFDEARNVTWAKQLEDAGCYVIYGIVGYKTHAKALLIVRREAQRIRRYLHLSTGNYNDRTARLYSDLGLLSSDAALTSDAAAFFNLLTGYSQAVDMDKLYIAPTGLRLRILELIDREIQASTPDRPGLIMAKVNSLQDRRICKALYQASRAGVRVMLNVRGICCLRPGVAGISENIEVVSIVDRYLEHARIFYFRNGGHEELYMSSADWMVRNLDKRLEILFPVQQPELAKRLIAILNTFFADNVKARRLLADGSYEPLRRKGAATRAQEQFYRAAVQAAKNQNQAVVEFRPLTSPQP